MKRTLFIAAIASIMTMGAISVSADDFGRLSRYAEQNAVLKTPPAKGEKRVVFFGNSITEGWWNLRKHNFFQTPGFIGRGIGGQTSYQFLYRFRADVVDIHAAVVVLNAGTNDVAENSCPYDEDATMNNIKSMVEIAQANNIKVILTSTLPASSFGWSKATNAGPKIQALNKRIKAYAAEKKLPFANYYDALVDKDGFSLNPAYSNDGVHPTVPGYEIMEKIIMPYIEKALKMKK